MKPALFLFPLLLAAPALAQDDAAADLALYRLDCGDILVSELNDYSDTDAYEGEAKTLVDSCYLIRHGEDYLLWDTGLSTALFEESPEEAESAGLTFETTLEDQLAELDLTPASINFVGVSHAHFDHVGNLNRFPDATLLIQGVEFDAVFGEDGPLARQAGLMSEFEDGENVERLKGDHDVFGDGLVKILSLPGHTPGHQGLLVNLAETGPVLLSGDTAHFTENWESKGVPDFNTDRADSLASMDRLRDLAENLDATLIIQHEPAHMDRLPKFPEAAE